MKSPRGNSQRTRKIGEQGNSETNRPVNSEKPTERRHSNDSRLIVWSVLGIALAIGCLAGVIYLTKKPSTSARSALKAHIGGESLSSLEESAKNKSSNSTMADDKKSSKQTTKVKDDSKKTDSSNVAEKKIDEAVVIKPEKLTPGERIEEIPGEDTSDANRGKDKIVAITTEKNTLQELEEIYGAKWKKVKTSANVAEYLELARWCKEKSLSEQMRQVYQAIIDDLDANQEVARRELGYVRVNATLWVREEDAASHGLYKYQERWWNKRDLERRGLVLRNGEWVSSQNVQEDNQSKTAEVETNKAPENLKWLTSPPEAFDEAKRRNTLVFVDVYGEKCGLCQELDKTTLQDPIFKKTAPTFVLLKVNGNRNAVFCQKYQIRGFPTLLLLDAQGKEIQKIVGYQKIEALAPIIQQALAAYDLKPNTKLSTDSKTSKSSGLLAPEITAEIILNDDGRCNLQAHRGDVVVMEVFTTT